VVVAGGDELVQQGIEGGGDGAGRVAEVQPGLPAVIAGQVTDGQVQDAAERLGIQQHQAGGGAGPDRDCGVGGEAAQQIQAALLGDGLAGGGFLAGDVEVAGEVAVAGRPQEEGADGLALLGAVGGVVAVDVGLGEGRWAQAAMSAAATQSPPVTMLRTYYLYRKPAGRGLHVIHR
jgi:hypothetical protein